MATKGDLMGKHARIGLLLGASACLLAAMVDWVVEELNQHGNPSAGKLASSQRVRPQPPTPRPGTGLEGTRDEGRDPDATA
jgi:hypothetical protein